MNKLPSDYTNSIKFDGDNDAIFGLKSVDLRSSAFGQSSPYSVPSSVETTTGDSVQVYSLSASVRQSLQAFQARLSCNTEQINGPFDSKFRDAPSMSAATIRDLDSVPNTINPVTRL